MPTRWIRRTFVGVIGLVVLVLIGIFSLLSVLLWPLLLVLGIFFRLLIGLFLAFFMVWLVGKLTLLMIEALRKPRV